MSADYSQGGPGAFLDRLEEARQAATPVPWIQSVHYDGQPIVAGDFDGESCTDLAYVPDSPADAALIVALVNAAPDLIRLAREGAALRDAVLGLHVPSHGYCVVCDKDRDVEAVGNAFPCDHYTSFCRGCDFAWPCPTARLVADTTGEK